MSKPQIVWMPKDKDGELLVLYASGNAGWAWEKLIESRFGTAATFLTPEVERCKDKLERQGYRVVEIELREVKKL